MANYSDLNFKAKIKLLFIACLVVASSQIIAGKTCKGLIFGSNYYDIEILKDGFVRTIHQLILNKNDNTLYFVYEVYNMLVRGDYEEVILVSTSTKVGYLNIDTREVGVVEGIRNASAIAIDQQYNKVYVGGENGIFKINNVNKTPERLVVSDNILDIYFKDVLFYLNRMNEAFWYKSGRVNPVFELELSHPDKIILDDDHNIFFTQNKSLFRVRLGTSEVKSHKELFDRRTDVLTTDVDGKPYIVTDRGIYTYNKIKFAFDKVSELSGFKGLTFNKQGDPIYYVPDRFIMLKHNPVMCFEPFE